MSKSLFNDLKTNYLEYLPKDKSSNILDFGCGNGRVSKYLLSEGYSSIIATDIDNELIDVLKTETDIKALSLENFEAEKYSFEGRFDLIIAKDVIYYLEIRDIIELLKSFGKLLKPNGVILIEIFNGSIYTGPFVMHKDLGILHTFTEHSLVELVNRSNFQVQSIRGNIFPITGVKSYIFSILQFVWRKIHGFIYFIERGMDPQNPKILNRKIILTAISN